MRMRNYRGPNISRASMLMGFVSRILPGSHGEETSEIIVFWGFLWGGDWLEKGQSQHFRDIRKQHMPPHYVSL